MRYLDPKADLTFKRVFGEHPELVKSLLNALLPLNEDQQIDDVEYLSPEMMPQTPLRKYSIVDVRCRDVKGRTFLVEMQMVWSPEFKQRVLFNASKAYVSQLERGENFKIIQPVYSLNLVNDIFEPDIPEYYHYYRMVHEKHSEKVIDGLHLVFIELPKFKPHNFSEKKMQVLWLRYLTEINESTREVDPDLRRDNLVSEAIDVLEESSYSEAQLLGYEKFWDMIRVERALTTGRFEQGYEEGYEKGETEGIIKGKQQGIQQGIQQGEQKARIGMARMLKEKFGMTDEQISQATSLSIVEIRELNKND